jgi:hypothetical protein
MQTGRERTHYVGDGCNPPHTELRQRPGDQPLPVETEGRPYIQHIVARELQRYGYPGVASVLEDIQVRCQVGLARYGTLLQAHNGRDVLRDLYEETMDGTFYVRQALEELGGVTPEVVGSLTADGRRRWQILYGTYRDLLGAVCSVRMLLAEREVSPS